MIMAGTPNKYVKAATQIRLSHPARPPAKALPKDRNRTIITSTARH